ncbi:hypothetical protein [Clostridioides difficile]|uniref:hypothetical protein n=1 Tax=Clostridioides difficile TaxID=1496 RepID=UPI002FCCD365|nr:hypothetical protein [Clostridioides phage phiCD08011]HBY2818971.1 hypothetical protein [Clostridioides difficile]HBY3053922.1 hypothetical protein [Clostridioides difficile]
MKKSEWEGGLFKIIYEQLEKEKKIKQEVSRLKKNYRDLEKEKVKILDGLVNEAAFLKISLEETREILTKEGLTEIFKQGKQEFERERLQVKIYLNFMKLYSSVMKQLIDIIPSEIKQEEEDELIEFIKKGRLKK